MVPDLYLLAMFIQFMFVVYFLSKHRKSIMDLEFENTKLKIRINKLEVKNL